MNLFLGGPLDGQRRRAHGWVVRAPVAVGAGVDYVDYVSHRLRGHSQEFTVYAPSNWQGDDILDRLINGPAAAPPGAQLVSRVLRVPVEAPVTVEELESRMIGEMAREVHLRNMRMVDWPRVERRGLISDKMMMAERDVEPGETAECIELRATARVVPRWYAG